MLYQVKLKIRYEEREFSGMLGHHAVIAEGIGSILSVETKITQATGKAKKENEDIFTPVGIKNVKLAMKL